MDRPRTSTSGGQSVLRFGGRVGNRFFVVEVVVVVVVVVLVPSVVVVVPGALRREPFFAWEAHAEKAAPEEQERQLRDGGWRVSFVSWETSG